MNINDYDILDEWRDVPDNPNLLVRADGAIKLADPIKYNTGTGAISADRMFSDEERARFKSMVHGNCNAQEDNAMK